MEPRTDFMLWSNLCRSFDVPFQLVDRLKDIEYPEDHEIVVMDETGKTLLEDFDHPAKAAYVFGYSGLTGLQRHVRHDHVVRVDSPYDFSMFAISIAPIVLYDRLRKAVT